MRATKPFQRDPLNWEGRAREEWRAEDGRQAFVLEAEPGFVHLATDAYREKLTEAGYTKAGDL